MGKIAIISDSNSGISQEEAKELGISIVPMPFFINGETYYEGENLTQEQFYERLKDGSEISTSMPSVGSLTDLWDELLSKYDEIVHIPMSSGLSSSCHTAAMLAQDYEGKVFVVDNQRVSVTQRQSVLDALSLVKLGKTGEEIKEILEENKKESSIYITLETLKYLKKGGRITPAAATLGTILNIKPVLQIQGDKLDAYAKTRGKKQAKKIMIEAMKKDFSTRFAPDNTPDKMHLEAAYAGNKEEAEIWLKELQEAFPGFEIHIDPLSLSVACHIGAGALAIACSRKLPML